MRFVAAVITPITDHTLPPLNPVTPGSVTPIAPTVITKLIESRNKIAWKNWILLAVAVAGGIYVVRKYTKRNANK